HRHHRLAGLIVGRADRELRREADAAELLRLVDEDAHLAALAVLLLAEERAGLGVDEERLAARALHVEDDLLGGLAADLVVGLGDELRVAARDALEDRDRHVDELTLELA